MPVHEFFFRTFRICPGEEVSAAYEIRSRLHLGEQRECKEADLASKKLRSKKAYSIFKLK